MNSDCSNYVDVRHFFDVLCAHDPPGMQAGEDAAGVLRAQCWVKEIAARNPEEAARKAEKFLTEQKGACNIEILKWRFSRVSKREGS